MADTWLTPAITVWTHVVGNPPTQMGRLAKVLSPLRHDGALPQPVLASLRAYLVDQQRTAFRFVSLAKWADTWSAWIPKPQPKPAPVQQRQVPDEPSMTPAQIAAAIAELRQKHPGSPYIATLQRMYGVRA